MSRFHLAHEAEIDLDDIWFYIARESSSAEVATRVLERITARFWLLAKYPYLGRTRDDLRPGLRSLAAEEYVIIHRVAEGDVVLVLRVLHGSRDIAAMLGH